MNVSKKDNFLEVFIEDNEKLLSVLGVFVAVAALTNDSKNWALQVVAFASLAGVTLFGYTILQKIDKQSQSISVQVFRYILLIGGTAFIIYWLSEFRPIWHWLLWFPMFIAVSIFLAKFLLPIVRKLRITRLLLGIGVEKRRLYQKAIRVISVLVLGIIALDVALLLSNGTNVVFDFLNPLMH